MADKKPNTRIEIESPDHLSVWIEDEAVKGWVKVGDIRAGDGDSGPFTIDNGRRVLANA